MAKDGNRSGAEPAIHAVVKSQKGDLPMAGISVTMSVIAIALLAGSASSLAQSSSGASAGGAASGTSAGGGSAAGSAGSRAGGKEATDPQASGDAAIEQENKAIDRRLKSICRGC